MASAPERPSMRSGRRSHPRLRALPELPLPGETIAGKYTLGNLIGEGGMGVVYEATHLRLHQRLAIKILRPDVPDFGEVVARFEREARAASRLQSIHTARVIDVDTLPNGLPYIVLEFLEGRDLDAEIEAMGIMPIADAVDVVLQVADAMSEAHALGIVHRDLKPSNLFVCRVGQSGRRVVKVLDFGISKSESDDRRLTPSYAYFGTPHYAAPEQLRAASAADARSDVWSLGSILFELLTGRTPFEGTPTSVIAKVVAEPVPWPTDLRPDLPRELARIVIRALQRDPQQRFQNMREFAQALAPFGPRETIAEFVADAPRARSKLGEILVADGLLTAADLEQALAEQRRGGKLLGRVLLDMRFVSQVDLLTALAKQQGVIVTPEAPSYEREARTTPPAKPRPPPLRVSAGWWVAVALIALPLTVLATLQVVARRGSPARVLPAGLVVVAPADAAPAVALAPSLSPSLPPEPSTPAADPGPRPPTRSPSSPAGGRTTRSAHTFVPTGI